MSLFRRAVALNTVIVVMAVLLLALSPATISASVTAREWVVLAVGTVLVIAVNVLLLRRVFGPLERLAATMRRIDPHAPGRRVGDAGPEDEVTRVNEAFNAMLDRLEHERALSGRRALEAQERERSRVARELHDELGQLLTGVVLQLQGLVAAVPPERRAEIVAAQDTVRAGVETVREISRGLRPPGLDEFGLRAALAGLASGFGERSGLTVRQRVDPKLPALGPERELAVYRVAQEAMTNVARHAAATEVELSLERRDGAVVLAVRDDGCGIGDADFEGSPGLGGMRERALLVSGTLAIRRRAAGGTEVRLEVPDE